INRIVTDRLSDFLFVSEPSGLANLKAEGVSDEKVFYTGNIMIDSLVSNLEVANKSDILKRLGFKRKEYIAMTMHRPANVDNPDILKSIIGAVQKISKRMPVVFPCHPRTQNRLEEFGLSQTSEGAGLRIIEPLGYLDFLKLQTESRLVLTDSGGIQEETTYLQIPCVTMRENTERPATVDIGTNVIVGTDPDKIAETALNAIKGKGKKGTVPELWDGKTAGRIVDILLDQLP
ncbi:MAG: UDP-N-acetylglucosamine 2-epimerase, partial [Candidatus Zixiibacteriota bacterium]